jgi:hypothetical protein
LSVVEADVGYKRPLTIGEGYSTMTRSPRDQIQVKAGNDVYTALAAVAAVVTLIGIIALFVSSSNNFNDNLFMPSGSTSAAGGR